MFGNEPVEGVLSVTREVALDVVQLHAWWDDSDVDALRAGYPGDVWRVIRWVGGTERHRSHALPARRRRGAGCVLDGRVGGTGASFDWRGVSSSLSTLRGGTRLIVAGGLRPDNVQAAIAAPRTRRGCVVGRSRRPA